MNTINILSPKFGNFTVLIDDEDYDTLNGFHWCIRKTNGGFYVTRNEWSKNKAKKVDMHRYLMGFPNGFLVDHVDGNTLNNQKNNLRIANSKENQCNRKMQCNNTTGYKGVHFYKAYKKYSVSIGIGSGKQVFGGYFNTALEAAKKYNELALLHHKEFAKLNTIPNE